MAAIDFPINPAGQVGALADMQQKNTKTGLATGVDDAPIGFGQPLQRVAGGDKLYELWDGESAVAGISGFTNYIDPAVGYAEGQNMPIHDEGTVWVFASGDCTAGGAVEFDPVTGGFQDAYGGDALAPEVAVFDSNATAGGVVRLQINTRIA